jgi:peptidoglycan/LPS O-acetylase OafA/YrhL
LKIEVMFYVVLPLLAVVLRSAGRFQWAILAAIYVSSEAWRATFEWMAGPDGTGMPLNFAEQLPGQMSFFVVGIGMAILRDQIAWRPFLVIAGLAMLALSILFPPLIFCRALGIGIVVIWIAVGIPWSFDAARFGDFSYGLYIVHFPIIQGLVAMGLYSVSAPLALTAAFLLPLATAAALWWFVERPWLRSDSAYRAT